MFSFEEFADVLATARALEAWLLQLPRGQRRPLPCDDALLRAVERDMWLSCYFEQLTYYHNADAWLKELAAAMTRAHGYETFAPKLLAAMFGGWRGLTKYVAEQTQAHPLQPRMYWRPLYRLAIYASIYADPVAVDLAFGCPKEGQTVRVFDARLTAEQKSMLVQLSCWHTALRESAQISLPRPTVLFEHSLSLAECARTARHRRVARRGLRASVHHAHETDDLSCAVLCAASVSVRIMPTGENNCSWELHGACTTDQWRFVQRHKLWRQARTNDFGLITQYGALRCLIVFIRALGLDACLSTLSINGQFSSSSAFVQDNVPRMDATANFLCACARSPKSPFARLRILKLRALPTLSLSITQHLNN